MNAQIVNVAGIAPFVIVDCGDGVFQVRRAWGSVALAQFSSPDAQQNKADAIRFARGQRRAWDAAGQPFIPIK